VAESDTTSFSFWLASLCSYEAPIAGQDDIRIRASSAEFRVVQVVVDRLPSPVIVLLGDARQGICVGARRGSSPWPVTIHPAALPPCRERSNVRTSRGGLRSHRWTSPGFDPVSGWCGGFAIESGAKIVSRAPTRVRARSLTYTRSMVGNTSNLAGHTALVAAKPARDDRGRIFLQAGHVIRLERRGCADDVAAEADRAGPLESEQMSAHDVLEVDAPIEQLVDLDVVVVRPPDDGQIVLLGEKPRRLQDETRQSVTSVEELAEASEAVLVSYFVHHH
jgi:hypothetical protein